MPFTTLSYFLFLPVVFIVHYFSPDRFRWLVLLTASVFFYAALKAPHLIAVLLLVTTITYFTGIGIDRCENPRTKQYLLWSGISVNILTLVILKYLPFLTQNLNIFLHQLLPSTTFLPASKVILAIGVSYFIFQAISYLVDTYLEVEKPERHFGHFALYMSFFPKLLQGPIERGGDLLPQFKKPYVFEYNNVRSGMLLFALGLLKKIVIADRLAVMVNPVFDNVYAYKGFSLLLATYYYSLQIYFDFSGYTDMALGTAMLFNINLTQNFDNPYFATSIADFWRRWHISFSRWILDYIFKPLQMSWRNWGNYGACLALFVTFTISGIWHGANWGFVVWGLIHGIYMASAVLYKPIQKKIHRKYPTIKFSVIYKWWQVFFTFNIVSIAWVFFRLGDLHGALYLLKGALIGSAYAVYTTSFRDIITGKLNLSIGQGLLHLLLILIPFLILSYTSSIKERIFFKRIYFRWPIYLAVVFSILMFSVYEKTPQFLYIGF